MVSHNLQNSSPKQSAMDEFDPVSNLERLKISTLKKAIALKNSCGGVTIGPSSKHNGSAVKNGSANGEFATSTPIKEKHSPGGENSFSPRRLTFDVTSDKSSIHNHSTQEKVEAVPHTLLLNVYEQKLRENVKEAMQRRLEKFREMDRKSKEELESLKNAMKMEALSKAAIEHERLQKELEEEEKNAAIRMEQLMIRNENHAKRLNEVTAKVRELEKKELEEQEIKRAKWKERKSNLDKIFANQLLFRQKYQEFCEFIRNCDTSKELMAVISSDIDKARFVTDSMDDFVEKCRDGVVEAADVENAASFVAQINEIYNHMKAQADKFKSEKAVRESAPVPPGNEGNTFHPAGETKSEDSQEFSSNLGTGEYADPRCLKTYNQLNKFLKAVEESFVPFCADPSLKQFRFLCQKAVITPVNAISPESKAHLVDKYNKLSNLLAGRSVTVNNKSFSATSHPLGLQFCKYTLAKKFVEQGEKNVSSHPEAAFAIATIIVALWQLYPDFGQLLLAFFHRVNPYLIPACWPQVEGQSNKDYYKLLGYEYSEDDEVEKQDKYLKRLSGVVRLYAAITITKTKAGVDNHPHGLSNAWRWFAAILNLEPVPDVTATFLLDFIQVAGPDMAKFYQKQFQKLLAFICKEYFPLIEKVSPEGGGAPLNRLKEALSQILKKGQIPPPKGLLPQSFWI
nr:PREDICTED: nucleoporin GLE1 [Bemisia tabaci]